MSDYADDQLCEQLRSAAALGEVETAQVALGELISRDRADHGCRVEELIWETPVWADINAAILGQSAIFHLNKDCHGSLKKKKTSSQLKLDEIVLWEAADDESFKPCPECCSCLAELKGFSFAKSEIIDLWYSRRPRPVLDSISTSSPLDLDPTFPGVGLR